MFSGRSSYCRPGQTNTCEVHYVNILYVCHRFPYPPKRGGKIRPFNMVRHLAAQGHRVTVASLSRSESETVAAHGIADFCQEYFIGNVRQPWQTLRMLARVPTITPSSMGYFFCPGLKQQIDRALASQRFDLIFAHCSSVAQYVEHVRDIPKILDFGDMDSQKWLIYSRYRRWPASWGFLYEGRKLEAAEKRLAKRFDICTCTSKAEFDTLRNYKTGTRTDWFPNGVDSEYFAPDGSPYECDTISFVGRMDYFPNQDCVVQFCRTVLPRLQEERPKLKFIVIGADPPRYIQQLAQLPGVEVTGSVRDVRPFVRKTHLMVAPLNIARGTQNKILEAMALGVPVVCSELAAEGVDAAPEEHLLTACDADGYVRQITRILASSDERDRLSRQGRERMLSHHSWEQSMRRMDNIIGDCLRGFSPQSSN